MMEINNKSSFKTAWYVGVENSEKMVRLGMGSKSKI